MWFLDRNQCLYKPDGSRRLADNALVALTLLIAESKPEDKDTMVTLVVNLINQENNSRLLATPAGPYSYTNPILPSS
ncbi:hypothetical protein [Hymenobacter citatus]|uniref:hypothetical protein n=1 Tax=Hymenobacter citatus TaxID=2763506 RepID=UPI001FE5B230|nr:hypothetical protein [Hymenobacter citatus]